MFEVSRNILSLAVSLADRVFLERVVLTRPSWFSEILGS